MLRNRQLTIPPTVMGYFKRQSKSMKPTIIILILLTYAFVELPLEFTDNFLAYLIPFCIAIVGLIICVVNFRLIKNIIGKYRLVLKVANIITIIVFTFLTVYNFPIPERSGLRCKNWTDIEMVINPIDTSEQYVFQSFELIQLCIHLALLHYFLHILIHLFLL